MALCAALLLTGSSLSGQTSVISGIVLDSASREPVALCNISVDNTFRGTYSRKDGSFQIMATHGQHRLIIMHVAYHKQLLDVTVTNDSIHVQILLSPHTLQLGTVTIEASGPIRMNPFGHVIDAHHARNVPALGEPDILRTTSWLPSVLQSNDLRAAMFIRGGSSDQTQFFLDGIEIYNPRHLLGLSGAFNLLALEGAEVYTGNLPARYGDRLSGVIDVQTIDPSSRKIAIAHLSLISSGFAFTHQRGNTSVLLGGRRTYLDAASGLFGKSFPYYFYDVNVRLTQHLHPKLSLDVLGFLGTDDYVRRPDNDDSTPKRHIAWGNQMAAVRLRRTDDNAQGDLTFSIARSFNNAVQGDAIEMDNAWTDQTVQFNGRRIYTKIVFDLGGMYKRVVQNYNWNTPDADEFFYTGVPLTFHQSAVQESYYGYGSVSWLPTSQWMWQSSLRAAAFTTQHVEDLSPRTTLFFTPQTGLRLHVSAGRYYQFLGEGKEANEGSISSPLFFLPLEQRATTYSAGIMVDPIQGVQLKWEAYLRHFDRIATLHAIERPYPTFQFGKGKAYGFDVWLEKSRGWWTGQIAYTFQRVFTLREGRHIPADWDVPHALKGMVGFQISKKWTVNLAGTYRSGAPFTPVLGTFFGSGWGEDNPDYTFIGQRFVYGETNSDRLPYYLRIDVSCRRTFDFSKTRMTMYTQIQNVFFRQHPLRYDWEQQYMYGSRTYGGVNTDGMEPGLPIIPSLGIELEWK